MILLTTLNLLFYRDCWWIPVYSNLMFRKFRPQCVRHLSFLFASSRFFYSSVIDILFFFNVFFVVVKLHVKEGCKYCKQASIRRFFSLYRLWLSCVCLSLSQCFFLSLPFLSLSVPSCIVSAFFSLWLSVLWVCVFGFLYCLCLSVPISELFFCASVYICSSVQLSVLFLPLCAPVSLHSFLMSLFCFFLHPSMSVLSTCSSSSNFAWFYYY